MRASIAFPIIGLLVLFLCISIATCKNRKDDLKTAIAAIKAANDTTRHYKDMYGRIHAERPVIEGNTELLQQLRGEIMDSVSKTLGILKKNIQSISAAAVVSEGAVLPFYDTIYLPDGRRGLKLNYSDRWISLKGLVSDTSLITYKTFDSLIVTTYRKRTGWFKKDTYMDAYSINPNSRIAGVTGIVVAKGKSKRFGIGPAIGFGYTGTGFKPIVGVSLQYSLIRF